MSWDKAMINARGYAQATGRQWFVRGYRLPSGRWRYLAASNPDIIVSVHRR